MITRKISSEDEGWILNTMDYGHVLLRPFYCIHVWKASFVLWNLYTASVYPKLQKSAYIITKFISGFKLSSYVCSRINWYLMVLGISSKQKNEATLYRTDQERLESCVCRPASLLPASHSILRKGLLDCYQIWVSPCCHLLKLP